MPSTFHWQYPARTEPLLPLSAASLPKIDWLFEQPPRFKTPTRSQPTEPAFVRLVTAASLPLLDWLTQETVAPRAARRPQPTDAAFVAVVAAPTLLPSLE